MEKYRVIIVGSSSFFNCDLMKEKCCLYLENKLKTHHVILLSGTSIGTTELIKRLSSRIVLIAFWDGMSTRTKQLIDMAIAKQIPVKIIRY